MIAIVESSSISVKPGRSCGADFRRGSLPRSGSGVGTVENMGRRRQGIARECATHGPPGACGPAERGQKWPQNGRLCPRCENRQEGVAFAAWGEFTDQVNSDEQTRNSVAANDPMTTASKR